MKQTGSSTNGTAERTGKEVRIVGKKPAAAEDEGHALLDITTPASMLAAF